MQDINLNAVIILILLLLTFGSIFWVISYYMNPYRHRRPPYPPMHYQQPFPNYNYNNYMPEYYEYPYRSSSGAGVFMIIIMTLGLFYVFSHYNNKGKSNPEGNNHINADLKTSDVMPTPGSEKKNTDNTFDDGDNSYLQIPENQNNTISDDVIFTYNNWSKGFTVQANSFNEEAYAKAYAYKLYQVFNLPIVWYAYVNEFDNQPFKVFIGIFETGKEADQFARDLPKHNFDKGFKVDLSKLNIQTE
ncbi:MAG: SPOR domain-containing protein [Saprospiraceae bacterium]|nr:SPOR domain-containing protein [Saprospiraceae bacterium]